MAEHAYLWLKANSTKIDGDSTVTSQSRENTIEIFEYTQKVITAREANTGMAVGRRQYLPLTFRKRIDKASPLIAQALTQNKVIEAEFKFYRPHHGGDGTTEQYYTVTVKGGRIASLEQKLPDTESPATSTQPLMEEVSLVFADITWSHVTAHIEHSDTWSGQG